MKRRIPPAQSRSVKIDVSYFRKQAKEAVVTFIAPFRGVYAAAIGEQAKSEETQKRPPQAHCRLKHSTSSSPIGTSASRTCRPGAGR